MTKNIIIILGAILALVAINGCGSLLGTNASQNSPSVLLGAASTNDPVIVADLKLIQAANAAVNPTPTEPLIASVLTGLIAIASAVTGAYVHAHGASQAKKNLTPPPPDVAS